MWESHLCAPEALFFSHLYKTASWRGVKVGKAVCMSSRGWKHRLSQWDMERVLCYTYSFPPSVSFTLVSLDWMGHNHNKQRNKNLWISESTKSAFRFPIVLLSLEPPTQADIHRPLLLSCPYTSVPLVFLQFPTITCSLPTHPWKQWAVLQYSLYALSPVLCQAQNLLEEHNLSGCMVCFQPSYISPGGQTVLVNFVGCR